MTDLNYDKIQEEIIRPQRLCLHCGKCMPILTGNDLPIIPDNAAAARGPASVWEEIPEGCGFKGWIFYEREKQKHLVRKIKEEIRSLSFLPENTLINKKTTVQKRIEELNNQISPWIRHGAQKW